MQKIIISDISTIGYLIKINQSELLEKLYQEIIIPRRFLMNCFTWSNLDMISALLKEITGITIQSSKTLLSFKNIIVRSLGPSEPEPISFALELKADLLIIDEQPGGKVAVNLGLKITGLIGIFLVAKQFALFDSVKAKLDEPQILVLE